MWLKATDPVKGRIEEKDGKVNDVIGFTGSCQVHKCRGKDGSLKGTGLAGQVMKCMRIRLEDIGACLHTTCQKRSGNEKRGRNKRLPRGGGIWFELV